MRHLEIVIPGKPLPKQSDRSRIVFPAVPKIMAELHESRKPMTPGNLLALAKKRSWISHYHSKEIQARETVIKYHIKKRLTQGWEIHQGPILITNLIYAFEPITSLRAEEKRAVASGEMIPKHTKPDITDNLNKLVFDCMEGIVYKNDSQIVGFYGSALKVYWKRPGTFIRMLLFEDRYEYREYIQKEKLKFTQ